MDRFQERIDQAKKALAALRELADLSQPTVVQHDALLLRFMLATEAVWKAVQRWFQRKHGLEVGSPREAVRTSLEVGLLDGEQAERALSLMKDRSFIVHAYNADLAAEIRGRVRAHTLVLRDWVEALGRSWSAVTDSRRLVAPLTTLDVGLARSH